MSVMRDSAKLWASVAAVLALFLVVTVLSTRDAVSGATVASAQAADATAPATLQVTLSEFAITPADLTVPAGVPVTVTLHNGGAVDHDLSVEGVAVSPTVGAGETATFELPAMDAGTYPLICSVAGHAGAGMEGVLTVTDDPAAVVPVAADAHAQHGAMMTPEEMARLHEQGVADFPVETEGKGAQVLEPTIAEDGTKVFELTAEVIEWETKPGVIKEAYAYNGMVPGPTLEAELGDRVRIVLDNQLPDPTAIHYHGLLVPNDQDGVPGLNQPSVMPGESYTYEFEVRNTGSHMYHSHFDAAKQVPMGLLGAFIVADPADPQVDVDYTMVLNDGPLGYTLNGKDFPATEPIVAQEGDLVRIRYMNEGLQIHPMHLHGMAQQVIAKDGYLLEQPYYGDTIMVAPGERIDVLVEADEVGAWAFHCHILTHAEADDGMFGMVTAMVVEGAEAEPGAAE